MKESPFGFEYSWEDLRPIRPLAIVTFVAQLIGMAVGLWLAKYPSWFENLWTGGAIATFPGFLPGLPVQMRVLPGSISEHSVMVRRMGLVSLLLSAAGVVFPFVTP